MGSRSKACSNDGMGFSIFRGFNGNTLPGFFNQPPKIQMDNQNIRKQGMALSVGQAFWERIKVAVSSFRNHVP
jgi:hypothetical protein